MKKFYFFLSIITMLIFQSCTPEHDKLLEEYIKEKPLKVLCKRQYRQDDALNVNITEYTVATVKSVAFIKESGEENYRLDTIVRTVVVKDDGTAYDKY